MVALALAAAALDAPPTSLQPLDPAPCAGVLDTLFNATALPDRAAWRAMLKSGEPPPEYRARPPTPAALPISYTRARRCERGVQEGLLRSSGGGATGQGLLR